jgi:hypothetical protein
VHNVTCMYICPLCWICMLNKPSFVSIRRHSAYSYGILCCNCQSSPLHEFFDIVPSGDCFYSKSMSIRKEKRNRLLSENQPATNRADIDFQNPGCSCVVCPPGPFCSTMSIPCSVFFEPSSAAEHVAGDELAAVKVIRLQYRQTRRKSEASGHTFDEPQDSAA